MNTEGLDSTDIAILRTLQENARLSNKEIAGIVHLSSTTVYERIRRLEQKGYINKYMAVLDAERLGCGFVVFCSVKLNCLTKKTADEFAQLVREMPEVTECYNISGSFDFLLKIHARDMASYREFVLWRLTQIPHIGSLESTFVMEEIKHDHGIIL